MLEAITHAVKAVFGDANEREIRRIKPIVARIQSLEPRIQALSDAELAGQTARFREQLDRGAKLDDLLPEAYATVREAGVRTLGMRHYDCQMVGGIAIHRGRIAEMRTGEGKTLVATLPSYLNALVGKGVHLVTVNDYLASRDADWMAPLYGFLGLRVGKILSGDRDNASKRHAYLADITYGTNSEFGFDYLRDNMKFRLEDYVQRGHHFAIIDEVDSILIDEARTPLIISGPAAGTVDLYVVVDAVVPLLLLDTHFTLDEKARNVMLTEDGITVVEDRLGIDNLYDPTNIEVLHHVMQALKAHHLFKRDRDYIVEGGEIVIVDEFTGRKMYGRRWSDGLHQAVEAKEKVRVQDESQTYATITYQNYFRMYTKLAGMTGTAMTEAPEFAEVYNLDVLTIPTNKPIARIDADDRIYLNQRGKYRAVVDEIRTIHATGQPVLVGTTSVEKSALVARMLDELQIPHEVLNAKQHDREASIVAQAGRLGAVTISTNMAGRGTDIKLGGSAEDLAALEANPEADPEAYQAALARWKAECAAECEKVKAVGGLHIVGTERHESRRVDNQLRGRAGRQGDPGSSRFYVALDDPLMRAYGEERMTRWMTVAGMKEDDVIETRLITNMIEGAQQKVETYNFNVRKNLLEYDDVMNDQRKGIYEIRRRALEGDGIDRMINDAVDNVVNDIMDDYCAEGVSPEQWNMEGVHDNLDRVFGSTFEDGDKELRDLSRGELERTLRTRAHEIIQGQRETLGGEAFEQVGRSTLLRVTDDLWKDHLLAVDRLRQSVGIRGYGQRNPLLEYKREAFQMFLLMSAARDERLLTDIRRARLAPPAAELAQTPAPGQPIDFRPLAMPQVAAPAPGPVGPPAAGEEARAFAEAHGLGRHDPCPCGSGKKYKKCCGAVA